METTRATTLLRPGDSFPAIDVALVGDARMRLPDDLAGGWAVVLFNRGAWCPFCTAQLKGFQRAQERLAGLDTRVVSLSVDDEGTTRDLVDTHGLTFPVGHSADAHAVAALTGAFVNPHPVFLRATGFVLDPHGTVLLSAYSSGAIGRIVADDAVGMLTHLQSRDD